MNRKYHQNHTNQKYLLLVLYSYLYFSNHFNWQIKQINQSVSQRDVDNNKKLSLNDYYSHCSLLYSHSPIKLQKYQHQHQYSFKFVSFIIWHCPKVINKCFFFLNIKFDIILLSSVSFRFAFFISCLFCSEEYKRATLSINHSLHATKIENEEMNENETGRRWTLNNDAKSINLLAMTGSWVGVRCASPSGFMAGNSISQNKFINLCLRVVRILLLF